MPRCLVFVNVDGVEGARLSHSTYPSTSSGFTLRGFAVTDPLSHCKSHFSKTSIQPRPFLEKGSWGTLGSRHHVDGHEHCLQDGACGEAPPFVYQGQTRVVRLLSIHLGPQIFQ